MDYLDVAMRLTAVLSCVIMILVNVYMWADRRARQKSRDYRNIADQADVEGFPTRYLVLTVCSIATVVSALYSAW